MQGQTMIEITMYTKPVQSRLNLLKVKKNTFGN